MINPQNKKETAAKGCLAAVPEGFGCVLLATLSSSEVSNHNHQRAAFGPMMIGTMVRMVVMMDATEAHSLFRIY